MYAVELNSFTGAKLETVIVKKFYSVDNHTKTMLDTLKFAKSTQNS